MSIIQQVDKLSSLDACDEKVVSLRDIRSSWLLQIDNRVLRTLLEGNAAHIRPTPFQVDAINQSCKSLVNDRELMKRFSNANIFLPKQQVKCANRENRQIFYCQQIENKVLRSLVKVVPLQLSRRNAAAQRQIDALNTLLNHPVRPEILSVSLSELGIVLKEAELNAVIEESQKQSGTSPYCTAQKDCETLQRCLMNFDYKAIKQQFLGYLSLVMNESALSTEALAELKMELTGIVVQQRGVPVRVENPFMSLVKSIHSLLGQLHDKRLILSKQRDSIAYNHLLNQIDKLLLRMSKYSLELIFRQHSALERWANAAQMSDTLYREIQEIAPPSLLVRARAQALQHKLHEKAVRRALQ